MLGNFLGGLANLGGISASVDDAQTRSYRLALQQLAVQQARQQQQARSAMFATLRALASAQQQTAPPGPTPLPQPIQQQPLAPLPPNMANLPQVPQTSGAMSGQLPPPGPPQTAGGFGVGGAGIPARMTPAQVASGQGPWAQPAPGSGLSVPQLGIQERAPIDLGTTPPLPRDRPLFMGGAQNQAGADPTRLQLASADQTYQRLKAAISPDDVQPTTQGTHATLSSMGNPLQFAGRMNFGDLITAIDKANPNADDTVKSAIFTNLYPMLNNQGKLDFQQAIELFKVGQTEKHQTATEEIARRREDIEEQRLLDLESRPTADPTAKGWQIMQTPEGGAIRVNPNTGETQPLNLPSGTTRMGTQQTGQKAPQSEVDYWSTVLKNGGSLPPGLTRSRQGADLVRQIMANMGQSGDPNDFIANIATKKAESSSLNNMMKMADAATSFEQTASRNFDLALSLSKNAVPTEWGPFLNAFIEKGETQAGNTDVPPYVAALLTAANEYAKIMSGSTGAQGSTVDARREAAQLFSPYLSANQIERVVAIAKTDMANRKQSLYGQIDDITARLRASGAKEPSATRGQSLSPQSPATPGVAHPGMTQTWNGKMYTFKGGDPSDQKNWVESPAGSIERPTQ